MGKLVLAVAVVAATVVVIGSLPDIKRYLEIRAM
jgi:hypothetical protein